MARITDRRTFLKLATAGIAPLVGGLGGCTDGSGLRGMQDEPDLVWGRRGMSEGRFLKPRAIAIDRTDQMYIVDTTGRIQVFDTDGNYVRGWRTPDVENGRPTGLYIDSEDQLLVADTHYHRVLCYSLDGELKPDQTIGEGAGTKPGQFAFVTDLVRDQAGNFLVGDYGDADRIQKFSSQGKFIWQSGGTGSLPGELIRPQSLAIDSQDRLWVADSCNHRIQVFEIIYSETPQLVQVFGEQGSKAGQLQYPYGITFAPDGTVWIVEYGNQRVQQFSLQGESMRIWGSPGHAPGQLYQPWGLVFDSRGRLHVLDSNNHRVQRIVV